MLYSEIVSKIDTVIQYDFLTMYNTEVYKRDFINVARETVGLDRDCRSCIQTAYEQMVKLRYKLSVLMAEGKTKDKYTLKLPKGKRSVSFGGIVITEDNYSDEAAEQIVKLNPALKEHFKGMEEAEQAAAEAKAKADAEKKAKADAAKKKEAEEAAKKQNQASPAGSTKK